MDRREFFKHSAAGAFAAAAGCRQPRRDNIAENPEKKSQPHAETLLTGSFLNVLHTNVWTMAYSDETITWKEDNWRALFQDMHAIGMDTVIWTACAFWGRPFFPGYDWKVGLPIRFMGCEDPLRVCAEEADRLGMKVFYGVGQRGRTSEVTDYQRMQKPWSDVWFDWNCALAEALVDRHSANPSFAGLYITYEIDFEEVQIELYERLIQKTLRPAVGPVKILASPGNIAQALPADRIDQLPAMCRQMGIDILAPQDCGGRFPLDQNEKALENVRIQAEALRRVEKPMRDAGIALWANCETFSRQVNPLTGRPGTPDGRTISIAGPIERIVKQIQWQAPYVQKLITWIYPGIMNRRTDLINIGHASTDVLYRDYVNYLKRTFPGRFASL